jgi:glycerol-3-phosphate acyltransferase PlsX
MGGDHGPKVTVPAALAFANSVLDAEMFLVGRESLVRAAYLPVTPLR